MQITEHAGAFNDSMRMGNATGLNMGTENRLKNPSARVLTIFFGKDNAAFTEVYNNTIGTFWEQRTSALISNPSTQEVFDFHAVFPEFSTNETIMINAVICSDISNINDVWAYIEKTVKKIGISFVRKEVNVFCFAKFEDENSRTLLDTVYNKINESNGNQTLFQSLHGFVVGDSRKPFSLEVEFSSIIYTIVLRASSSSAGDSLKSFNVNILQTNALFAIACCPAKIDIKKRYICGFRAFAQRVIEVINGESKKDTVLFDIDKYFDEMDRSYDSYKQLLIDGLKFYPTVEESYTAEEVRAGYKYRQLENYYKLNLKLCKYSNVPSKEEIFNAIRQSIQDYGCIEAKKACCRLKQKCQEGVRTIPDVTGTTPDDNVADKIDYYIERDKNTGKRNLIKIILDVISSDENPTSAIEKKFKKLESDFKSAMDKELALLEIPENKIQDEVKNIFREISEFNDIIARKIILSLFDFTSYEKTLENLLNYYDENIVNRLLPNGICYRDNYDNENSNQVAEYCEMLSSKLEYSASIYIGMETKSYVCALVDGYNENKAILEKFQSINNAEALYGANVGGTPKLILFKFLKITDIDRIRLSSNED